MHRILYITGAEDPLTEHVIAAAGHELEIDQVHGADLPDSFHQFDAVLVGEQPLDSPLTDLGEQGAKLAHLTRGHHFDIDVMALNAGGVTVAGASPALADYVSRETVNRTVESWQRTNNNVDLGGITVGIVGFGRIGSAVARRYVELGANVIYADVRTAPHNLQLNATVRRSSLDLLLSKSDIVSLHVQWGPTSDPLIDARELRLIGPESLLVNAADSRLVDADALSSAVGAGSMQPLLELDDLPVESSLLADVAEFVVGNIKKALEGSEPEGVIEMIDFPRAGDPAFWSSRMSPRVV